MDEKYIIMGAMNRPLTGLAAFFAMLLSAGAQQLDFDFYRTRVEPVFLKKRPEHARCVSCHTNPARAFRLQPLPAGGKWTAEETRKNFETVSKLVVPGKPESSLLLRQPLAGDAGGERFHSGGRQFRTKDDPDWQVIAEWVKKVK